MTKYIQYVSRAELVDGVQKARRALRQGVSTKKVARFLEKLDERAQVTWNEAQKGEVYHKTASRVQEVVSEYPGITFADLAEEIGFSINHLKTVVDSRPDMFTKSIREDRKGMYGRKPYGVWLKEDTDE